MMDAGRAESSSLVVADRRPQRKGGCSGIFSQLIDWNRKFAKKLFFARKVLPPARSRQASKKLKGHGKLPKSKLLLIAGNNNGGFPSSKKLGFRSTDCEKRILKQEMRSASLVARLMGLESMPVLQQEKHKNKIHYGKDDRFVSGSSESGNYIEKDGRKTECRPPKGLKAGLSGADGLQLKGILLASRKHRSELASPVSPRKPSGRRASRLIGAATRILEPGLHAKKSTKYALTYSNYRHGDRKDDSMTEGKLVQLPEPLMEQSSCKACGSRLNVRALDRGMKDEQSSSSCSPSEGSECVDCDSPSFSSEQEMSAVFSSSGGESMTALVTQVDGVGHITERDSPLKKGFTDWHLPNQCSKPPQDASSSQAHPQIAADKDMIPARSSLHNLRNQRVSPDANASNRPKMLADLSCSSSDLGRPRMPNKLHDCQLETERRFCNKQDNSFRSPVHRRRRIGIDKQVVNSRPQSLASKAQRSAWCALVNGNELQTNAGLMEMGPVKRELVQQGDCSQMRHEVPSEAWGSMQRNKRLIVDKLDRNGPFLKQSPQTGNGLGEFLEHKLKKLACQEEGELGGDHRSTSMALQVLLSAFCREMPISTYNKVVAFELNDNSQYDNHAILRNQDFFQAAADTQHVPNRFPDSSHLFSPESVLEASFSNDSCFSSSSSGTRLHPTPMDCSTDQLHHAKPNFNLLDSASSLDKKATGFQMVTRILNEIPRTGASLTGLNFRYGNEVILDAELLFGNATLGESDGAQDFLILPLLLYKLESLARRVPSPFFLGFHKTEETNQLRSFLLDCAVEYLDSKCVSLSKLCYNSWRRLRLSTSMVMLVSRVDEEIERWRWWAGKDRDEIIDGEMRRSSGIWIDFETEGFEIGTDIGGDLLESLVGEVVVDLYIP